MIGEVDGAPSQVRLRVNQSGVFFNEDSFAGSHLHLDNARVFVRTNSYGNTLPVAELRGTATGSLSGGNAGSAARWEIGSSNNDSTFAGVIDGNGGISINKVGTGKLTLSGTFLGDNTNSSLAIADNEARQGGVIRVTSGSLAITGATSIPGGFGTTLTTIDVLPDATFDVSGAPGSFSTSALQKVQGGGTILGNYDHDEGFIRPGDVAAATAANEGDLSSGIVATAGTINFDGDLQLNGGSIVYDMTLDPNSGNDLVHVTGSTALNSGTITPNFFNGVPSSGTYTVLTSDGGFTGSATNITVDFPGRGADPVAFLTGNSLQFTAAAGGGSASLVWTGATDSTWDVETTQNWDNSGSPDVFFNLDSIAFTEAAGNKAVTVSTTVTPSGTITIDNTTPYTFTGAGAIIGSAGLTKTGSGMLTMQVANTFSGPADVTGTVDIGGFGSGLGTGPLTMTNTTLLTTAGIANSSIEIPTGTTSTIQADGDSGSGGTIGLPTLTGGGTLTITSTVDDKWFAPGVTGDFTGTLNVEPSSPATLLGNFRIRGGQTTFPNAVVNLTGVSVANQQGGAEGSTATFEFGELHGDAASVLNGFVGGSTSPNANWVIGGLGTDSDFAGTIIDGAGGGGSVSISSVTKVGMGTLTLTGANTYTGDTTVDAGTLSINNPFLADTADVFIATGAVLDLDFSSTDIIDSLYLGGTPMAPGNYGSLASSAANKSAYFNGMGVLSVTTLGPVLGVTGDYNDDGIVNAADYTVWRNNLGGDAAALAHRDPNNAGVVSQADYDSWKANFGMVAGAGAASLAGNSSVPEPTGIVLAIMSMGLLAAARSGRFRR